MTYVILNLAVVALLRTGALRVNSGALTQGQVVALYNYMSQILVELIKFANLIITMTKAVAWREPDSKRLCHAIQPDFWAAVTRRRRCGDRWSSAMPESPTAWQVRRPFPA